MGGIRAKEKISTKTVGRLSVYRRVLRRLHKEGRVFHIFSHALADKAGVTPAQVRRDIMAVGYNGSPTRGYAVRDLLKTVDAFLSPEVKEHVALVGIGNLGRAVLAYLAGRRPSLEIVAAFDKDPQRYGRVIAGCRTYNIAEMPPILKDKNISVGVIAVPADAAQEVADAMIAAGVSGLLNFAPVSLHVPDTVYVENMDLMTALEKVAYFAHA